MKSLLLVANFKSNKTTAEAKSWIEEFSKEYRGKEDNEVVICSPFTSLSILKEYIKNNKLEIKLGAEDVSAYSEGPFTGEINAKQIKELADYVVIGHSERRKNFNETDDVLEQKTRQALKNDLTVIYCIQDKNQKIPAGVKVVAYEPIFAIGTGNPDTPDNARSVALEVKKRINDLKVIYGGSVTEDNVKSFTELSEIDGVLVGGASLDAKEFNRIIQKA